MKYFCLVGTHDVGFDRLIRALDEYAGRHPEHEYAMQIGSGRYRPVHAAWFDFKPTLAPDLERADIVITQGSISIFDVLRLGKKLVVAPRLARYGEVMNDHQLEFSNHHARRFDFPVLVDLSGLEAALKAVEKEPPPEPVAFQPTGLYQVLGDYLDKVISEP